MYERYLRKLLGMQPTKNLLSSEEVILKDKCIYLRTLFMNNNTNEKNQKIEYNNNNNNDIFITHNFKDITSKFLAQLFKGDSLRTYGFQVPKVESLEPTELPAVMVNDLMVDNLFLVQNLLLVSLSYLLQYYFV